MDKRRKRINWKKVWQAVEDFAEGELAFGWYIMDVTEKPTSTLSGKDDLILKREPGDQYAIIRKEIESQGIKVDWNSVWLAYTFDGIIRGFEDNWDDWDIKKILPRFINKYRIKEEKA